MKLAFLVDIHGHFESVPSAMQAIGPVDLLVIGGDITTMGSPEQAARAVES